MTEKTGFFSGENFEDRPLKIFYPDSSANPNEQPSSQSEYKASGSSDFNYPEPVRTPRFEKATSVGQPESDQPQAPPEQQYDGLQVPVITSNYPEPQPRPSAQPRSYDGLIYGEPGYPEKL